MNDDLITFTPTGFGYVNEDARVVLVGITPGSTQLQGDRIGKSSREIKRENAFAGGMRKNLVRMLDCIGINGVLGISTCATLWDDDFDKVEMTSLLKDATFYKGKMFNKASAIFRSAKLTKALNDGFANDCRKYTSAVAFVALGYDVGLVLSKLKIDGVIHSEVITIPHPSWANAGRAAVFLGQKDALASDAAGLRAREQYKTAMKSTFGLSCRQDS